VQDFAGDWVKLLLLLLLIVSGGEDTRGQEYCQKDGAAHDGMMVRLPLRYDS